MLFPKKALGMISICPAKSKENLSLVPTIFYSWQDDCPKNTNRNFIENAILKAIKFLKSDIDFVDVEREESKFKLDKDTKGVGGSPPIVDTIFKKIDKCSIFVADVSYIGRGKRALPNPNVMIEYGWGLKQLGYNKIVAVMNTAFGDPKRKDLPFDLKHVKWPIRYHLPEDASDDAKKEVFEGLVMDLKNQFKTILGEKGESFVQRILFSPVEAPDIISCFLDKGESLGNLKARYLSNKDLVLDRFHHLFIRFFPRYEVPPLRSPKEASDLCHQIAPPCEPGCGTSFGRNKYGSFSCVVMDEKVLALSQLMLSKEIWGIDAFVLCPYKGASPYSTQMQTRIVNIDDIKVCVNRALESYLMFYQSILKIKPPYRIIVGLYGIRDFAYQEKGLDFITVPNCGGRFYQNEIVQEFEISDKKFPADQLNAFYDLVAETADITPLRKR